MGISLITCLEIFTNPNDLEMSVGQDQASGKYAFCIGRGPEHDFKILVSTSPFATTLDEAITSVKETLQAIQQGITRDLEDKNSLPSQFCNPRGETIDQLKIFNEDLIEKIVNDLKQNQVASTYLKPETPCLKCQGLEKVASVFLGD
jgi:hypothetical protein